jgi:heme a synthase
MIAGKKLDAFARFTWFVLAWNILVILWGVFLRASKSGDGCGQHWLTCGGEVIPSAPALKTTIEFSHRITSSLAGFLIVLMLVWAWRRWRTERSEQHRLALRTALGSLIFVVIEGLLGAGLVLTGNTAENLTPERPLWTAGHLINTFILLAFLTLTARYASGGRAIRFDASGRYLTALAAGVAAVFVVGMTGSIAALANMIFPSGTLAEGLTQDFSPTSNLLVRLRLLHPITAILTSVFLVFLTGWLAKESGKDAGVTRWSNALSLLVLIQIAFGSVTLYMLAPIVMQIGHLLLADLIWISYVLLAANFLSLPAAAASRVAESPPAATLDEVVE